MPTDGNTQAYEFLDRLSTEQLLNLLRADFDSPEEGNAGLTFRILEVIEEREKRNPTGLLSDAGQAWEDFQRYFNTPDGEGRSLYPTRDSEIGDTPVKPAGRGRPLKRMLALAAVVAVAVFGMIAAQALGVDVFGALARWTDETFHFTSASAADLGGTDSEVLRLAVQEAFDSCGITIPAPAWYPEGTELVQDIDVVTDKTSSMVQCSFSCGKNIFNIVVQQQFDVDNVLANSFEKSSLKVEEYLSNGRLFYIMSNLDGQRAIYSNLQTIITISGDLSSEDLKHIINSIGG